MELYKPCRDFRIISINSAFIRNAYENFYYDGEIHDFWEMIYAKDGSITISEDDKIYELAAGQAVFHKPMEFHRLKCRKGQRAELIIISFSAEGTLIDPLGNGVFELNLYLQQMLTDTLKQINSSFDCSEIPLRSSGKNPIEENLSMSKLESLLLSVLSEISPSKKQSYSVGAHNYKKIIDVMNGHIDENLSVDEIASLCCLSTSNLKKTFKTYAGCGVTEHYNRLRIIRATEYLKSGMSVTDISRKMSFSSPGYFSNVFKRETGLSPLQYRSEKM